MEITVLGMGQMGRALAGRLIDGGHRIRVWNRTPGRATSLVERGAVEGRTPADAVVGAEVVLTSLTDDAAVREVLLPEGRPLVTASGTVVVESSTVSPAITRELGEAYNGRFVAAPVMGSPAAVSSGMATLALGGPDDLVDRLAPVWDAVTPTIVRCGQDPGRALVVKLVNNLLLLGGIAVLAEGIATAQAAGIDDELLRSLLGSSPLVAPGLHNRLDAVIDRDHTGWFPTPLGAKDLGLLRDLAATSGLDLPLASTTEGRYRTAIERGLAEADIAAVADLYPVGRPGSTDPTGG